MGVLGTEVGIPGVKVGVEVQHGYRLAGTLCRCTQQRKGDRVVPAQGQQPGPALGQVQGPGLDGFDGLVDVERVDRQVTGISNLQVRERGGVLRRVVGTQQAGRLTDVVAAKAGTGAVGDTGVERDTHNGDVGVSNFVQARKTRVRPGARITRNLGCVDGAYLAVGVDARLVLGHVHYCVSPVSLRVWRLDSEPTRQGGKSYQIGIKCLSEG